ncbi:Pimeloyl-ACP methyl ester carboxylesterase [Pseudooceanicola nitratireducens]|jgi:pimeloyl-ACP methyl ester carboxylesterase|uniref:Pimeloyl-ACP methyl ester carboxylesterase n=1 Tax=Pseudooceanicola nitratireducens TaxID=517719 RepID=A0A1I1M6U9_9RHOB|nr:alpha/beta hydrolase [Pseudooceanicola nitratireducens]SEI93282.1 Pimeloyl-ACP methyl ester carboxylesterase [Pseudooceanicola nitratireducens]SFC78303.1 Pimeloyl-ACP methyl ester carboxylesterase [Pseudooceanicola nitratireducens]
MIWILALLALLALVTLWRVRIRSRRAEADFPPEGLFLHFGENRVHYVQKGKGPDLVLIHGASGNTRDFTFALMDALSDRYRVTIFDRPGLGHSPRLARRGVTLRDQADLLAEAAQRLGVKDPILLGQSFGGAVAMAWAVHHPSVAAVVNVSGATYPWPGALDRLYATLSRPVIGPVLAHVIGAWVSDDYIEDAIEGVFAPQSAPFGYAGHIGAPLVARPHSLMANAQQRTDLRAHLEDLSPAYAGLTLPIEIVHGDADDTVSLTIHSEAMARDVPGAVLTRLPGVGHMPHHVSQDHVIAAIDRAAARAGLGRA